MKDTKTQLHEEFENYLENKSEFLPYYPGMNIYASPLYKKHLKEALTTIEKENTTNVKSFELYLDTIILNMHTKVKKYKQSIFFDEANIKDIENQGYTIPFYIDEEKNDFILLGLVRSH